MANTTVSKITALMPKDLIAHLREATHAQTMTEALIIAASDWVYRYKTREFTEKLRKKPFHFRKGYSAEKIRALNRQV